MPGPQLVGLVPTLYGEASARYHFAESGTVMYDLHRYRMSVHEGFLMWVDHTRPSLIEMLRAKGFETLEPGVTVNIIFVGPRIDAGAPDPEFRENLSRAVEELPGVFRDLVELSFGQDGNMADLRPVSCLPERGWNKLIALDQIDELCDDVDWSRSYYAGDTSSDEAIAEEVLARGGFIIAPGNASAGMKELASRRGFASRKNFEEGFLEGLMAFQDTLRANPVGVSSNQSSIPA
jgi:hypothetical protein